MKLAPRFVLALSTALFFACAIPDDEKQDERVVVVPEEGDVEPQQRCHEWGWACSPGTFCCAGLACIAGKCRPPPVCNPNYGTPCGAGGCCAGLWCNSGGICAFP